MLYFGQRLSVIMKTLFHVLILLMVRKTDSVKSQKTTLFILFIIQYLWTESTLICYYKTFKL